MAQRKITISLGATEAAHLEGAIKAAQQAHQEDMGRPSAALTAVAERLREATEEAAASATPKRASKAASEDEAGDGDGD